MTPVFVGRNTPICLAIVLVAAGASARPTLAAAQGLGPAPAGAVAIPAADTEPAGQTTHPIDAGPLKNLRFSGLVQVWYQAGNEGVQDTFRVRRTELYIGGDVTARARFMLMIDPSKLLSVNHSSTTIDGSNVVTSSSVNQASRILQDAYVSLAVVPHLDVQAGQFKLPLNFEGLASSYALPLVERSLMTTDRSRGGAFGDVRDVGLMARGTFASGLEYRVGIFNGLGSNHNDVDKDDRKAVAGRLAYRAPVKGLRIGGFGAIDREATAELDRRRAGVDAQYVRGPLLLQAELVGGMDGALKRRGYYATVGYKIGPAAEVVARLDMFDPDTRFDTNPANVAERDYDAGFTYCFSGNNVAWQAEYLRKTFAHGIAPSRNVFLMNMQIMW
jgi:hypothetical protein